MAPSVPAKSNTRPTGQQAMTGTIPPELVTAMKALADAQAVVQRAQARQDDAVPDGVVFIPFAYVEAAANLLTNPALDPFGKIPEFKYCAVKVTPGGDVPGRMSFGGGSLLAANEPAAAR